MVGQRNKKRLIHNQSCLGAAFVSTWLNKQIFAVETKSPRGWHTQGDFGDHTAYTCSTVLHTARAIDLDLPSSCRSVPRGLVPGHPKHPLWIRHCTWFRAIVSAMGIASNRGRHWCSRAGLVPCTPCLYSLT